MYKVSDVNSGSSANEMPAAGSLSYIVGVRPTNTILLSQAKVSSNGETVALTLHQCKVSPAVAVSHGDRARVLRYGVCFSVR